jgi:hypothetical protein
MHGTTVIVEHHPFVPRCIVNERALGMRHPMRCPAMKISGNICPGVSVYSVGVLDYNGCTATLNFINCYVSGVIS